MNFTSGAWFIGRRAEDVYFYSKAFFEMAKKHIIEFENATNAVNEINTRLSKRDACRTK